MRKQRIRIIRISHTEYMMIFNISLNIDCFSKYINNDKAKMNFSKIKIIALRDNIHRFSEYLPEFDLLGEVP